jgi:hypothetical protein
VRKIFATMSVVAPLLAACGDEALIPELKGRWQVLSLVKLEREASSRVTLAQCNVTYVTFSKREIAMRMMGSALPLFHVSDVKRDGPRLLLTGRPGSEKGASSNQHKLVLLLREGEVRFGDIFDDRGRSVRDERLASDHPLRVNGVTTRGEALGELFNVKQCQA